MRDRTYDVHRLLRKPEPPGIPLELSNEWDAAAPDLAPAEMRLYLVDAYLRGVNHGGHEFWFGYPEADHALETAAALEAVGFAECAAICRRSLDVWPDSTPPTDFDEREAVISDVWLEDDPDGVMERLEALDHEFYELRYDDTALYYRHIVEHPADFGIDPATAPPIEDVLARLRRVEAQQESERQANLAAARAEPSDDSPIPESDTFRPPPLKRYTPWIVCLLAALTGALLFVNGETHWGAFAVGLAGSTLVMGVMSMRRCIRMGPEGVGVNGRAPIPWALVTGCRINALGLTDATGFDIRYTAADGTQQSITVPADTERYDRAFATFLELALRHEAPWSLAEGFRTLRAAT